MEIKNFIENFANQFDDTDISEFKVDTEFKQLDEWCSVIALGVIAMVNDEYGVILKGDEIRSSKTIEDLFEIVKSRA